MPASIPQSLIEHWVSLLGWVIFGLLLVARLLGYSIFDPFVFGFAYYTVFVLSRVSRPRDLTKEGARTFAVCLIALIYLFFHWYGSYRKGRFVDAFERNCDASVAVSTNRAAAMVCSEIQQAIDDELNAPVFPESSDN